MSPTRSRSASVLVTSRSTHIGFGGGGNLHAGTSVTQSFRSKQREETAFLEAVRSGEGFVRLQREYAALHASDIELEELLGRVCSVCWQEVEKKLETAKSASVSQGAQAEIDSLRKQLAQCNLQAMKQINALKSSVQHEDHQMDEIMFFEPLKFLEKGERDLVLGIVVEKIAQIEVGNAPNSLVSMIKDYIQETGAKRLLQAQDADDVSPDEDAEVIFERLEQEKQRRSIVQDMLKSSEAKLTDATERLQSAEEELKTSEERLKQVTLEVAQKDAEIDEKDAEIRDKTQRLEEVRRQLALAEETCEDAQAKASEFQQQLEKEHAGLDKVVAKQREAEEVESRLRNELNATAKQLEEQLAASVSQSANSDPAQAKALQKALDRIKALEVDRKAISTDLTTTKKELSELQEAHDSLKANAAAIKTGAADLQTEVQRHRSELKDSGAQTANHSNKENTSPTDHSEALLLTLESKEKELETVTKENKKLKVMLEELKAKLQDLMAEFKKRGMITPDIEKLCEEVGLKSLLKAPSIFQRLYDDALDRVDRLERLREKYRAVPLPGDDASPTIRHGPQERSRTTTFSKSGGRRESLDVLTAVQQSDLIGELAPDSPKDQTSAPFRRNSQSSPRQAVLRRQTMSLQHPAAPFQDNTDHVAQHQPAAAASALTSPTRLPLAAAAATPSTCCSSSPTHRRLPAETSIADSSTDTDMGSPFNRGFAATAYPDRQAARFPPQWVSTSRPPMPPHPAVAAMSQTMSSCPPPGSFANASRPFQERPLHVELRDDLQPPVAPPPPRLLQHSRMDCGGPVTTVHDGRRHQAPPVVTWVLESTQQQHHHSPPPARAVHHARTRHEVGQHEVAVDQPHRSRSQQPTHDLNARGAAKKDTTEGDVNPVAAHMRKLNSHQSEPTLPVIDRGQIGRFQGFGTSSRLDSTRGNWR